MFFFFFFLYIIGLGLVVAILPSILTPGIIWVLFFDQFFQVNNFIELVRFCSWITDETFRIKTFSDLEKCQYPDQARPLNSKKYLHDFLTVHAEISTTHHLQINCSQGQRPPFASWLLVNFGNLGLFCIQTSLQHDRYSSPIEEMNPSPEEVDFRVISSMHDFDAPKSLRFEVPYP